MLNVETIRKVRKAHFVDGKGIRQIARDFNIARNTVREIIRSGKTDQKYQRSIQPRPKLGTFADLLSKLLKEDSAKPVRHRRSAQILFEQLQREGYEGGYDAIRRYVSAWKKSEDAAPSKAFIPLEFDPGEAFQFDWSYEQVELGGVPVEVKVAQFRLCHSRKPYCVAYTRESLEIVLDAHAPAFEVFGGVCRRGIYDNLKTVVTKVLMGKDRVFNRRFQNLASHYLFEPVACTPAADWEKGQVENQVSVVRSRFFVKRRRFANLEDLNEWLEAECRNHAATASHPERKDRTIDEVFAEEKGHLLSPPTSPFDGYQETVARVWTQLLVSFDRNRYSVNAMAVGKTVAVRSYADRLIRVLNNRVVGVHRRHLGRDKVIYDPWHYVAVLEQKPGALRNGAPFKRWDLPVPLHEVRGRLEGHADGDRQFVAILSVVRRYSLDAVAEACAQALLDKTVSSDVILAILSRQHDEPQPEPVHETVKLPRLTLQPIVDCHRYDLLLSGGPHGTA
ncbi:IS21 family transposase [Geomonas sp. RF6]|uniref:IS21 family transposase n=1 Tax=Geomonas sp. RF6 TaxID=2897342 RepID=UPI001E3DE0B5|nr:IS21 family transposase [Geomonas sp. RF6]UFS71368.1 IS21 family transposase [Geomonas sp. RF6]